MTTSEYPARPGRWVLAALVGALSTAWGVRSLLADTIFLDEGFVLLGLDDSAYHARRAFYDFANFPEILFFDQYMAYPDGSPIPFPPLYDFVIAAVARCFGDSPHTFECVAAWAAVCLATATLLPVYGLGRLLRGSGAGVAAAWIFAVLPASSLLSSVGYLDHHAAVAFLGATWLWSSVREICEPPSSPAEHARRIAIHAVVAASLVLTWSGSLLYLGLAEGARLAVGGIVWCHRDRLRAQSASAAVAALLVAPWVAASPAPIDGAFSSTALSWLHVLVLLSLAAVTAALSAIERARPSRGPGERGARVVALATLILLPQLAIPGLLDTLTKAFTFVSGADVWAASNPEQQPLFSSTREELKRSATVRFGWLAFGVPLLPLLVAIGLRDEARREGFALLLVWTSFFTVLALMQVRFAHDLAPLASVVFAITLAVGRARLARFVFSPFATAVFVPLGIGLLWPALADVHGPRVRFALREWGESGPAGLAPLSPWESEARFATHVRAVTPETSGFLDASVAPEYGLLVDPSIGHSFLYWARRPVPANNFGQYLDREKFDLASAFYETPDATRALEALDRLAPRYVVTSAQGFMPPMPYGQRLHREDGLAGADTACMPCLRLVTEGPPRGSPRRGYRMRGPVVPYKLFERVAGARIEVSAAPGVRVRLNLGLETPLGRRFVFEKHARVKADGRVTLRVPYSTEAAHPVRATGPYRVEVDGATRTLDVSEDAVREGASVAFEPAGGD